jgi:hypothetical protein
MHRTCSCCVAKTVAGFFTLSTATFGVTFAAVEALDAKPKATRPACKQDNHVVACAASASMLGVVAYVLA